MWTAPAFRGFPFKPFDDGQLKNRLHSSTRLSINGHLLVILRVIPSAPSSSSGRSLRLSKGETWSSSQKRSNNAPHHHTHAVHHDCVTPHFGLSMKVGAGTLWPLPRVDRITFGSPWPEPIPFRIPSWRCTDPSSSSCASCYPCAHPLFRPSSSPPSWMNVLSVRPIERPEPFRKQPKETLRQST